MSVCNWCDRIYEVKQNLCVPGRRKLLETAEVNGIHIPYGCRQGQCGTCATRLLGGEIRMDREDGLDSALKAEGYVLKCRRARAGARETGCVTHRKTGATLPE